MGVGASLKNGDFRADDDDKVEDDKVYDDEVDDEKNDADNNKDADDDPSRFRVIRLLVQSAWRKTKSVSEKDFWINASADLDCMQTIWMHQITYLSIRGMAGNLIHGISSEDLKDTEFLKKFVHFLKVA